MKDENGMLKYIGIGILILLGIIAFKTLSPKELNEDDCLKLGSNYRTQLCLEKIASKNPIIPSPTSAPFTNINQLVLEETTVDSNSYYEQNPTLNTTLRNNSINNATNVIARFKIFKFQAKGKGSCDDPPLDTVYLNIADFILAGDSKRIKVVARTNVDTSRGFSWCVDVVSATQM